jgi:hypothetical protein
VPVPPVSPTSSAPPVPPVSPTSSAAPVPPVSPTPASGGGRRASGDQARRGSVESYTSLIFAVGPDGLNAWDREPLPNQADVRAAGWAAAGGVGSARGLAKAYATAYGGIGGAAPLVGEPVRQMFAQEQVWGEDRVLGRRMAFGIVYQRPHAEADFGGYAAFGHDGAGGALGLYDPEWDLAVGYVPRLLEAPTGPAPNAIALTRAIRACLRP